MSGILGAIAGTASTAIGAVTELFGGSNGVTLGTVTFSGVEVPEKITWGGGQSNARNVSPGGTVNVSAMGIQYEPLSWSGYFEGPNALDRSRSLYTMMLAGQPVSLAWNDRLYTVLVTRYLCDDTKPNWLPYRIVCDVISDQTTETGPGQPSLFSQVTSDLSDALGLTPDTLNTISDAIQKAQTLATAAGAVLGGSPAALQLQTAVSSAQNLTGAAQALAGGNLAGVVSQTAGAVFPLTTAKQGVVNFNTTVAAASQLSALPQVAGRLGRVLANVGNASA
jgi:hypothetical protein